MAEVDAIANDVYKVAGEPFGFSAESMASFESLVNDVSIADIAKHVAGIFRDGERFVDDKTRFGWRISGPMCGVCAGSPERRRKLMEDCVSTINDKLKTALTLIDLPPRESPHSINHTVPAQLPPWGAWSQGGQRTTVILQCAELQNEVLLSVPQDDEGDLSNNLESIANMCQVAIDCSKKLPNAVKLFGTSICIKLAGDMLLARFGAGPFAFESDDASHIHLRFPPGGGTKMLTDLVNDTLDLSEVITVTSCHATSVGVHALFEINGMSGSNLWERALDIADNVYESLRSYEAYGSPSEGVEDDAHALPYPYCLQ